MKLMIGYLLVVGYLVCRSIYSSLFTKPPETYDDLMKLDAFTLDEDFQRELKGQKDLDVDYKKAHYERKNKVG